MFTDETRLVSIVVGGQKPQCLEPVTGGRSMVRKKIDAGYVSPGVTPVKKRDYVVVELRHNSKIAFSSRGFAGPADVERPVGALNDVLSSFGVKRIASHFGLKDTEIRQRVTKAPARMPRTVTASFAHSGFVQVVPRKDADAKALADRLNRSKSVWKAMVAPQPVPAALPTGTSLRSRNFEPAQGYLASPPNGIGAMEVWKSHNAKGQRVTICDIEGNWNFRHEDLPKGTRKIGGDLIPGLAWEDHGTAVLGEIVSKPSESGTVGIAHKARAVTHSAVIAGVWNTAQAIVGAAKYLRRGDVILIELQGTGPRGRYVAMQYWDDVFSAIRFATDRGITVVEAAGNGDENFNLRIFNGTGLQKDSGAIVVGAGVPPTNWFDYFQNYGFINVPRSRIWFSNYGRIVNVQAWGWHVTTLGYGDAQGGKNRNRWYTHRFSGTSSASPIVTGAVACIQGRAWRRRGSPLTPAQVRSLLIKTGTPQVAGRGVPVSQHIGPQPNLPRALRYV